MLGGSRVACCERVEKSFVGWRMRRVGWLLGGLAAWWAGVFPSQSQRASTSLNHHPVIQSSVNTRVCCCHKPKI